MSTLDLALIGNCTVGALVDARANITWGCFPRFDGDPVFCSLLKDTGDYGFFAVELADCERTEQHYLENSAILVTRLYDCHGGAVEVTDFAPRFGQYGRMFRPMMLVRSGDFIFRYVEKDDFGAPENAFLVCTFWYVNALAALGRREEAHGLFEKLLSCRNSHGLLAEHIDPRSGEQWGNFVQTYSMVGLINAAIRLSIRWDQAF